MIKLTGITLRVKKIRQGRFGDFCVADLSTDIGEFKVKDPILDQFEDGEYTGTVWVSEIFLSQYMAWGKAVTEIRARLHDLQLDSGFEREAVHEAPEPDPVEEPPVRPAPQLVPTPPPRPSTLAPTSEGIAKLRERLAKTVKKSDPIDPGTPQSEFSVQGEAPGHSAEVVELFGDLWQLIENRQPVKFDPTVDRIVLRKQSASMVQLGYKFNPIEQTWYPV